MCTLVFGCKEFSESTAKEMPYLFPLCSKQQRIIVSPGQYKAFDFLQGETTPYQQYDLTGSSANVCLFDDRFRVSCAYMSSVKIIRREHKQLLIGANDTDMHKNHFKTTTLIGHQKKM